MTLNQIVESLKCRKGKANGTTKDGAYWLACKAIVIRRYGGDGVGENPPDMTNFLEIRHYRDGAVRCRVNIHIYHQHESRCDQYINAPIGECLSVEGIIVALKGLRVTPGGYDEPGREVSYSDRQQQVLTDALVALGLPEAESAPDEVTA